MDVLLLLKAAMLGIVEGLTEFLPISSTGHLIIAADLMGFTGRNAKVFEIAIQLGAILGVAWDCRARLRRVATGLRNPVEQRFVLNLLIAFLPAAGVGLLFHREIKEFLFNPVTVAWALIVGGIVILAIERLPIRQRVSGLDDIAPREAFIIGVAQVLSLFPGASRAGATIMGGLIAGLPRTTATEFSFFLAIPVMVAATIFELYGGLSAMSADDLWAFVVGFLMSYITAVIVVKLFLRYVSNHSFSVFAWYRIVFGGLVLGYFRWPAWT